MNYNRVYAQIDLDAVEDNMKAMAANLEQGAGIIGVVKADAYGHGSVPVAKAIQPYVWGYAVAAVEEGRILRNHGITKPILILGSVHPDWYEEVIRLDLRPTLFQREKAERLSKLAVRCGKRVSVHIAVDTGMSRIGMSPDAQGAEEVKEMSRLPGLILEGLFTHFAKADETDKASALEQLRKYLHFSELLKELKVEIPLRHCSNSAGIIDLRQSHLDLVRAGIAIYGLYPSDEVKQEVVSLRPAMELKSIVNCVKIIEPGTQVSYGGLFTAFKRTLVATIPTGYADGYPRNLSGKGWVLIHGQKAPILGRVCMDQFMVDVTDIPDVREEDEVTLIGCDGREVITMENIAALIGGYHYELICDIGKRVPRVYVRSGDVVGTKDYFDDEYGDFLG